MTVLFRLVNRLVERDLLAALPAAEVCGIIQSTFALRLHRDARLHPNYVNCVTDQLIAVSDGHGSHQLWAASSELLRMGASASTNLTYFVLRLASELDPSSPLSGETLRNVVASLTILGRRLPENSRLTERFESARLRAAQAVDVSIDSLRPSDIGATVSLLAHPKPLNGLLARIVHHIESAGVDSVQQTTVVDLFSALQCDAVRRLVFCHFDRLVNKLSDRALAAALFATSSTPDVVFRLAGHLNHRVVSGMYTQRGQLNKSLYTLSVALRAARGNSEEASVYARTCIGNYSFLNSAIRSAAPPTTKTVGAVVHFFTALLEYVDPGAFPRSIIRPLAHLCARARSVLSDNNIAAALYLLSRLRAFSLSEAAVDESDLTGLVHEGGVRLPHASTNFASTLRSAVALGPNDVPVTPAVRAAIDRCNKLLDSTTTPIADLDVNGVISALLNTNDEAETARLVGRLRKWRGLSVHTIRRWGPRLMAKLMQLSPAEGRVMSGTLRILPSQWLDQVDHPVTVGRLSAMLATIMTAVDRCPHGFSFSDEIAAMDRYLQKHCSSHSDVVLVYLFAAYLRDSLSPELLRAVDKLAAHTAVKQPTVELVVATTVYQHLRPTPTGPASLDVTIDCGLLQRWVFRWIVCIVASVGRDSKMSEGFRGFVGRLFVSAFTAQKGLESRVQLCHAFQPLAPCTESEADVVNRWLADMNDTPSAGSAHAAAYLVL